MSLDRRDLVRRVLAGRGEGLVVAGLGSPAWDCFAAGDDPGTFYLWGAMGLALPVALGLAVAQPARRVLCVTGDGELMMGAGSLAVAAAQRPGNLAVLVLDNGAFGETGRQAGLTAAGADIAGMAAAAGFAATLRAGTEAEVPALVEALWTQAGPVLAVARIALASHPLTLPERDGAALARRLRTHLGAPD